MIKKNKLTVNENSILKKNIAYRVRTLSKINYLYGEGECYELNEVANSIWDSINGFDDINTVILNIAEAYQQRGEDISDDILKFVNIMVNKKVFLVENE